MEEIKKELIKVIPIDQLSTSLSYYEMIAKGKEHDPEILKKELGDLIKEVRLFIENNVNE